MAWYDNWSKETQQAAAARLEERRSQYLLRQREVEALENIAAEMKHNRLSETTQKK